jgi:putative phosphoesterase
VKILITSDVHSNLKNLNEITKKENNISYHFDLGDFVSDTSNNNDIIYVKGNCDFGSEKPLEIIITLDNKKMLFVHGHKFNVKSGLQLLSAYCNKNNIDICFYGHTHIASIIKINSCTFINPGSVNKLEYALYENNEVLLKKI